MSSFGWLDHSEHERRKALDVIKLLSERDTRDELGIGTVRDGFSDMFFPGTSTIQTRARYFLFVPWIYLELENKHGRSAAEDVAQTARRRELGLIEVLASSADPAGTIGVVARQNLKRLPSNIYWQGLGAWGIRVFSGTQPQYHRFLGRTQKLGSVNTRDDDGEPIYRSVSANWHPSIPEPPRGWAREASLSLLKREAVFLRERVLMQKRNTMLAFLIDNGLESGSESFPWQHRHFAEFPEGVKEQLQHARSFSETIHGAALLYNLMLAEKKANEDWIQDYRDRLGDWASSFSSRRAWYQKWNRKRFWEIVASSGAKIPLGTRVFIDRWLGLTIEKIPSGAVGESDQTRTLIRERERSLKGENGARLFSARALEIWDGRSGTQQLNFRWPQARTITADILTGLQGSY